MQVTGTVRRQEARKRPLEAMRCLKRRLPDVVYRQLVKDAMDAEGGDDERRPGRAQRGDSSVQRGGLPPHTGTSDQPVPGPAPTTLDLTPPLDWSPSRPVASRRRLRPVRTATGVTCQPGCVWLTFFASSTPSDLTGPCPWCGRISNFAADDPMHTLAGRQACKQFHALEALITNLPVSDGDGDAFGAATQRIVDPATGHPTRV